MIHWDTIRGKKMHSHMTRVNIKLSEMILELYALKIKEVKTHQHEYYVCLKCFCLYFFHFVLTSLIQKILFTFHSLFFIAFVDFSIRYRLSPCSLFHYCHFYSHSFHFLFHLSFLSTFIHIFHFICSFWILFSFVIIRPSKMLILSA